MKPADIATDASRSHVNSYVGVSSLTTETAKVVFMPSGRRGEYPIGTPLLQIAQGLGVDIASVCGGRGICGRCQVECAEGNFQKHQIVSNKSHLNSLTDAEKKYAEKRKNLAENRRLSCLTTLQGDVVIDVPPESQVHQQIVRKEADLRDIVLDSTISLHYVDVEEADMHQPKGDLQRLLEALAREWKLNSLDVDLHLLQKLQPVLREGHWKVTVAVYDGQRIIDIWPGFKERVYGLAIDIGSTTVAAHLCNLHTGEVLNSGSLMNPQIRFGEDLMSRVSYVMMHPEGAVEMTEAIRSGLNKLIEQIATEINIAVADIMELVMVGNPVMHHILLGINPVELGGAPFALATDAAVRTRASDMGIQINAGGMVYVLPCIAGHVGADAAGVVLSEEPQQQHDMTLLVDVGTNAEIVLGNKDRLMACSSPTGPAFEGAQISSGQRAAPGAIERVHIDPVSKEPRFRVIGSELWSNEEGFDESIKKIGVNGICGSGIIEVIAEMYLAGIISTDGVIDGDLASVSPRIIENDRTFSYVLYDDGSGRPDRVISVTQNDVRQIQLGKAALYAGVRLLMDKLEVTQIERIRLAGAFGSHIDVKHAMVLGLIPDCPLDNVASAGNAAGTGARIALLNKAARHTIETVVRNIEKIETAVESKFQDYFVDAMAFPHKTDPFPNLFSVVTKPPEKEKTAETTPEAGSRRRRRRRN
ncbi:MAG: drug:proton antiporter [Proteobacteria bacterium]|nr:MAG: drug:proton antiporter [Pseudomonadota bacterium]